MDRYCSRYGRGRLHTGNLALNACKGLEGQNRQRHARRGQATVRIRHISSTPCAPGVELRMPLYLCRPSTSSRCFSSCDASLGSCWLRGVNNISLTLRFETSAKAVTGGRSQAHPSMTRAVQSFPTHIIPYLLLSLPLAPVT